MLLHAYIHIYIYIYICVCVCPYVSFNLHVCIWVRLKMCPDNFPLAFLFECEWGMQIRKMIWWVCPKWKKRNKAPFFPHINLEKTHIFDFLGASGRIIKNPRYILDLLDVSWECSLFFPTDFEPLGASENAGKEMSFFPFDSCEENTHANWTIWELLDTSDSWIGELRSLLTIIV